MAVMQWVMPATSVCNQILVVVNAHSTIMVEQRLVMVQSWWSMIDWPQLCWLGSIATSALSPLVFQNDLDNLRKNVWFLVVECFKSSHLPTPSSTLRALNCGEAVVPSPLQNVVMRDPYNRHTILNLEITSCLWSISAWLAVVSYCRDLADSVPAVVKTEPSIIQQQDEHMKRALDNWSEIHMLCSFVAPLCRKLLGWYHLLCWNPREHTVPE